MREYFRFSNLRKEWNREHFLLLLKCFLASTIIAAGIEVLSRRSIDETITFIVDRFPAYFYNALLIYFTMTFALLFRRRTFSLIAAGGTWLGVAIANCILLSYRSMPLTAPDIWLMSSVRTIFDKYLSYFELGVLMFLISVAIAAIFFILYSAKKHPVMFGFAFVNFLFTTIILLLTSTLFVQAGILQKTTDFDNLPDAYAENGFCYCFAASLITGGVDEPETYSPVVVDEIIDAQKELPETTEDKPNIIFVQLESFFDANYMSGLTYEANPVPNFQVLREAYPSGLLSVPCIGAGTANTEFEVLTGMNLTHFGVGEYPYMTIVDATCPETIAYVLGQLDYTTHAIHNNNATFYDRDLVYANLSFDTFTSIEYMDIDPETDVTPTEWAHDAVLTEEIMKCLESTADQDFVFAVSVQAHGRYPSEYIEGYPFLEVEGMSDAEREIGFEYFLYQLRETDAFIGQLVDALSDFSEKTVIVFYGDHLPSFNIQEEELLYGNEQTTEYIIWSNYDLGNEKRDLQTYQLSAYVLELCGIYEGSIFRLHQSYDFPNDEDMKFQDDLQVLEYDMLSGEHIAMNGEQIYPAALRFDVEDILIDQIFTLTDAVTEETVCHIFGQNFTRYSIVYINDEPYETEFISKNQLSLTGVALEDGDMIVVAQISAADELEVLSQTEAWIWEAKEMVETQ